MSRAPEGGWKHLHVGGVGVALRVIAADQLRFRATWATEPIPLRLAFPKASPNPQTERSPLSPVSWEHVLQIAAAFERALPNRNEWLVRLPSVDETAKLPDFLGQRLWTSSPQSRSDLSMTFRALRGAALTQVINFENQDYRQLVSVRSSHIGASRLCIVIEGPAGVDTVHKNSVQHRGALVFIAFSGSECSTAAELAKGLRREGVSTFLSADGVPLGTPWRIAICDALYKAQIVLILVGKNTEDAFYFQEEIAEAINRARSDGFITRVIPVWLEGYPRRDTRVPYGLRSIEGVDAKARGIPYVVKAIARLALEVNARTNSR